MPGRIYSSVTYRYGFNGQEKDDEVSGSGNSMTAEFWQYDTRLGRRWNVDPVSIFSNSSYLTFGNNPLIFIDPNGSFKTKAGAWLYSKTHKGDWEIVRNESSKDWAVNKIEKNSEGDYELTTASKWKPSIGFKAEAKYSVGLQLEFKDKIQLSSGNQLGYKIGGGVLTADMGKSYFELNSSTGASGSLFKQTSYEEQKYHNYFNGELGGKVFGKDVGAGIKTDYTLDYYNSDESLGIIKNSGNFEGEGYFFGKSRKTNPVIKNFLEPSLKPKMGVKVVNGSADQINLSFGGGIKVLLGVDVKIEFNLKY